MQEYLDILDKDGNFLGRSVSKKEVHSEGFFHNTAHVWFYTQNGEVLLAQRAASKSICPLLWDVSVAGHVDAGEKVVEAAVRETKEEIGLSIPIDALAPIGVFECFQSYDNGITDNEFHHTFIALLKVPLGFLQVNTKEVNAIKLVSLHEFHDLLDHSDKNNHFIASNRAYYIKVLECINNAIKI